MSRIMQNFVRVTVFYFFKLSSFVFAWLCQFCLYCRCFHFYLRFSSFRRRTSLVSRLFVGCAFVDSLFYLVLVSYTLYIYFTQNEITVCPWPNPLDPDHLNQSAVEHLTTESVPFYGFTAIILLIFFIFFLFDAIAGENTMQLLVSMLTSFLVTYYTVYKSIRFKGLNYA